MAAERQTESVSSYDAIAEEYNDYLSKSDERVCNEVSHPLAHVRVRMPEHLLCVFTNKHAHFE